MRLLYPKGTWESAVDKGDVMSNKKDENDVFHKIINNYNSLNELMVQELDMSSNHPGITGDNREQMWMKFFRSIIPLKFAMAQGVLIIDCHGNVSREVDIAVYDEQYTPYVFQYNTLKFIPIEAVAVVIECKSRSFSEDGLKEWVERIQDLNPRSSGIARMATGYSCQITNETQKRTRPVRILASMKSSTEENISAKDCSDYFDFVLYQENNHIELIVKNIDKSLGWWTRSLNIEEKFEGDDDLILKFCKEEKLEGFNPKVYEEIIDTESVDIPNKSVRIKKTLVDLQIEDNPLLSLNFQLNQLLMLLNNPMLFPHFAYARLFNHNSVKEEEA